MAVSFGVKVVFGVPEKILPLAPSAPAGRRRFRFRNTSAARVRIKTEAGIQDFVLIDAGDHWGLLPQGRNFRVAAAKAVLRTDV